MSHTHNKHGTSPNNRPLSRYLEPALAAHPSLSVVPDAHVRRVLWDGGGCSEGATSPDPRAIGVEIAFADGMMGIATARKEVILAAGAIASPMLLQLSGVGPREVLDGLGVPLVHALPGVGGNLQDHLEV